MKAFSKAALASLLAHQGFMTAFAAPTMIPSPPNRSTAVLGKVVPNSSKNIVVRNSTQGRFAVSDAYTISPYGKIHMTIVRTDSRTPDVSKVTEVHLPRPTVTGDSDRHTLKLETNPPAWTGTFDDTPIRPYSNRPQPGYSDWQKGVSNVAHYDLPGGQRGTVSANYHVLLKQEEAPPVFERSDISTSTGRQVHFSSTVTNTNTVGTLGEAKTLGLGVVIRKDEKEYFGSFPYRDPNVSAFIKNNPEATVAFSAATHDGKFVLQLRDKDGQLHEFLYTATPELGNRRTTTINFKFEGSNILAFSTLPASRNFVVNGREEITPATGVRGLTSGTRSGGATP